MNKAPLTCFKSWPSFMLIGRLLSEIDHPPYFLYRIMCDPLLNLPELIIFLFCFSLSFSLAFDKLIICLFSLLQKADFLLIIYNACLKNDLAGNDFRTFYVFASICTRKAVSFVITMTP